MPGLEHWWSLGAKSLGRSSGKWYHEVTLGEDFGLWANPQIGWATDRFVDGSAYNRGVGDCKDSWGVCGLRHKIMHGGEEDFVWPRTWQAGDTIGLAIDIDEGVMQFSLNGQWISNYHNGFSFDLYFFSLDRSFFPALSMLGSFKVGIARKSWRYSPPSDMYLAWGDSGQFEYKVRFSMVRLVIRRAGETALDTAIPLQLFKCVFPTVCCMLDSHRCIVDENEIEIISLFTRWRCECGHVYNPYLDNEYAKDFQDLPAEWPCPDCGQRLARNWRVIEDSGVWWNGRLHGITSESLSTLRSLSLQDSTLPYPTTSRSWYPYTDSTCTPRSSDDLDAFSDAGSWGASSPRKETTLVEGYWRCDQCDETLEWAWGTSLWCKVCNGTVAWPIWQSEYKTGRLLMEHQECVAQAPSQLPCSVPETNECGGFCLTASTLASPKRSAMTMTNSKPSSECLDAEYNIEPIPEEFGPFRTTGAVPRSGLGREPSPARPGHRAAGGNCGPWWTKPSARYITSSRVALPFMLPGTTR